MSVYRTLQNGAANGGVNTEVSARLEAFFWKLLLVVAMSYLVWSENFRLDIGLFSLEKTEWPSKIGERSYELFGLLGFSSRTASLPVNSIESANVRGMLGLGAKTAISNLPTKDCRKNCLEFVDRYKAVAVAEMRRSGVPASILLAQSMLASDAGQSPQAEAFNNYFLQPCVDMHCALEHAAIGDEEDSALTDVFPNPWAGFAHHCTTLVRYPVVQELIQRKDKDYRTWATALEAMKYSPSPAYGQVLQTVIRELRLEKYDKW